jgi:hypothetical protein
MRGSWIYCAAAVAIAFSVMSAPAWAKTAAECNEDYAANKAAIKASGQKKKDYIAACKGGTEAATPAAPAPAAAAPAPASASTGGGKTAKECNADYAANKAAIKASGQKKGEYVAACRAGTAPPVAATPAAAPAPAPAPEPAAAAPAPAPVAAAPAPKKPKPMAAAPTSTATPTAPGQFAAEAQAKARCPTDVVVWVNTKTSIYHFAGSHRYGTTKHGAYMCEADAKTAGDRAAEKEKHP